MSSVTVITSSQQGHGPPRPSRRMNLEQPSQRCCPTARTSQSSHAYTVSATLDTDAGTTTGPTAPRRRRYAAARQASEQKRRRPAGVKAPPQAGQAIVTPS